MNSKKIVREIMKQRGHTYDLLASKLGFKTVSSVSERLRGAKEMRVDTLVKFLSKMDYEVVIRSTTTDKTEWVVTLDDEIE